MKKLISLTLLVGLISPIVSSCAHSEIILPQSSYLKQQNTKYSNTKSVKKTTPKKSPTDNTLVAYLNNNSCGMFQTKKISNDFITARHCKVGNIQNDSPVYESTGKPVKLSKPRIGNATIVTKHFNQSVQINVKIVELNSCQAFFLVQPSDDPLVKYIQSGDSGSPVVQYDSSNNPLVVGALSGGFLETKIEDVEINREAFLAGSIVYDDCNKFK